jgi:6-phosphogluconolactonase
MIDSNIAFVGTYSGKDEDGIFGFRIDEDGSLKRSDTLNGGEDPTFLTADSGGDHLYVANRPDDGGMVVAYAINREMGTLTRLNAAPTYGGGTPCYCSVDATDQYVLTAQYGGGTVSVLPINEDGCVGEATSVVEHEGSGPDENRQSEPHPHSIVPGPNNNYVYVPDLGADRIFVYDFRSDTGELKPADCGHTTVQSGAGPRHLDFHPTGEYAYLINELDSTVIAFDYDPRTGALDPLTTVTTLPDVFDGENVAADIHVHASGNYLYASNRGHDSIVIYELDGDGLPNVLGTESTRGDWPRNFALDPAGAFLFAENADTDTIVSFHIEDDGTIEPTGNIAEIPSPVCMQFI